MLVDGAPQPVRRPGDLDDDLIEVPLVTDSRQSPPDLVGEPLAKLQRPLPHRLVTDDDAAGGQHLLDHPQAQREAEIQPDRVADDLGRKAVTGISVRSERLVRAGYPLPPAMATDARQVDGAIHGAQHTPLRFAHAQQPDDARASIGELAVPCHWPLDCLTP